MCSITKVNIVYDPASQPASPWCLAQPQLYPLLQEMSQFEGGNWSPHPLASILSTYNGSPACLHAVQMAGKTVNT